MRSAMICAAIVIAGSSVTVAHEKKVVVRKAVTPPCADLSGTIKKKRGTELDCRSTGTVSGAIPQANQKGKSEPRLGYDTIHPGIIPNF
ncbi:MULTISPECIES: hypothetical protein [unclassified Mesorhizobium]|uniref:hypothetical protein n=1 Tax=unclassified Mesorhizobium TaxID=325217 RepID=UPI000FD6C83F|nr:MULTISPECIES: hypothetical protein [unclassified Mesorhizobium]TGQ37219.1 hypothetical protein EN859_019550 [Mesorhizobium sp. M00.F.Ca.ET.216.01.1.1]TIS56684.1 MAG: hypothetical protein E5W91_17505 [Mesorhizobium sp.]TIS89060.1 MAG: hypothetical protein E5W89_17130 [Mesorhizobium sp.]TJW10894.1 MAG: hypothetical protein E5W82_18490 [Mesorhizobium sp.]TJW38948.1 MAG: hypothetical protein E5W83_31865 [Mesorhizobium sp.]